MITKKSITLSHLNHLGNDCIRFDFAYDQKIVKTIVNSKFARWGQSIQCWYIKNERNNLKILSESLEKIAKINYIPAEKISEIKRINEHSGFMSDPFAEYSSLFISYSFKDKIFVNKLNDSLCENGVNTFLWEKDAPFGEPLKEIMNENVHKYDRVLFIASENSLKSPACQFEISEARKKQDKLWKTVLFPIHIDNFLFEIKKENIKPRDKVDEYWLNICELKEINSLDFSDISAILDNDKFYHKIKILLKSLKNN
jgi:hypothetical protein